MPFDGGVLNSVLATTISFSLIDDQTLADAKVDLFAFGGALATRRVITGPTHGSAAITVVSQSAALNAPADTIEGGSQTTALLRQIAAAASAGTSVPLAKLIDVGPGDSVRVGSTHPCSARVARFSLLSAIAQLGGQNHIVPVALGASIPGLSSTTLLLTAGDCTPSIKRMRKASTQLP